MDSPDSRPGSDAASPAADFFAGAGFRPGDPVESDLAYDHSHSPEMLTFSAWLVHVYQTSLSLGMFFLFILP
jgi:hypothetical protein